MVNFDKFRDLVDAEARLIKERAGCNQLEIVFELLEDIQQSCSVDDATVTQIRAEINNLLNAAKNRRRDAEIRMEAIVSR